MPHIHPKHSACASLFGSLLGAAAARDAAQFCHYFTTLWLCMFAGGGDDLISLGSSAGGATAVPAAAAGAAGEHVAGEEQLVSDMDQLLLAAQPSRGTSGAGAGPTAA